MILDARSIGGVETQVLTLSEELAICGHKVIVISPNKILENKFSKLNVKHYTLPVSLTLERKNIGNLPGFLFSIFRIIKVIKNENVDVIHSHAPSSSAYLAYTVSKILKKPLVYTIHGAHPIRFFWKFFKHVGSKCNAIIAISEEVKDFLCSNLKIENSKIFVIYNGINLDKFSPMEGADISKDNTKKLVHVTRLDKEKVEATLKVINATLEIVKEVPNIQLLIIGHGDEFENVCKTVQEVNAKLGRKVIKMAGHIEPEKIPLYLHCSDVVIGAGRVAVEGMACGKPVIFISSCGFGGTLTEENCERIKYHNFSGRGCKSNYNSKDIAQSVIKLLKNPTFYHYSQKLSVRVANTLDIKKIVRQLEKVYNIQT